MSDPNKPDENHESVDRGEEAQPTEEATPTQNEQESQVSYGQEAPAEAKTDPNQTVYEQIRPIVGQMSDEDKARRFEDALFLLMSSREDVSQRLEDLKPDQLTGGREDLIRWQESIREVDRHYPDVDVTPFNKPGGHWRQAVENEGEELTAGRPRLNQSAGKVTGESALLRVRAAVGLGTITNVPLWHSGMWLKLKAPSESTLLELERRIARDKTILGRATMGVAFSNVSVYTQSHLTDMIFNHVYDGSTKELTVAALKERILITDIPQLIWGMACTIWPNGYRLVRPCVKDPSVCTHTDEAHINLSKISWVNNRMISKVQRNLMSDRDGKFTDEQLSSYRKEHSAPQSRLIKVNDGLSLRLQVPTIADYEHCGFRWIDEIERMTDEAFGQRLRGEERERYILQQSAMTNLRRYSHWVKEVVFSEDSVTEDRESVDEALDSLSGETRIANAIIEKIEDFMRDCVINAIGIPSYDCPKCGNPPDEDDLPRHLSEIIQLEVNEVFFTLHYMRVLGILESE